MDAGRLMDFLSKEGFRPSLAAPGDVRFKYEGGNYMVRLLPKDDQYVVISYANFWRIGSPEEEIRALRAANQATLATKVAKIGVVESQHNVWADAELLVTQPEQFEALFYRTLGILKAAVARFVELMRASEPLPDKRVELKREEVTRWMHGN